MKKILIGSIIAALGGAAGTVYFAVKYRKEVKHHWQTRYKYEDELKEQREILKGKTNYDAWELEYMMDDISKFILNHESAILRGLDDENEKNGINDTYDEWDYFNTKALAAVFQEEYKRSKAKEK